MPFIIGGELLKKLNMQHHHDQKVVTMKAHGMVYAVPLLSWLEAMTQMKYCGDDAVLRVHKEELEEVKEVAPHTGVSKAYTLRGQGRIPIQVGKTTKAKLHGWVRVEADDFGEEALPIAFEPTICKADDLFIEAFTALTGPVNFPARSLSVRVTPILRTPLVIDDHLVEEGGEKGAPK